MSETAIPQTGRTEDVLLYIQGVRGGLMVGLNQARINGVEMSKKGVRAEILKQWGLNWSSGEQGSAIGAKKAGTWISGPMAR